MEILYKPLAEILLLHEFYCTDSKLASVFDVAAQTDRMTWLADNYDPSEPSITTDLPVVPDSRTATVLRNQQMRLVSTNWGFMLAVRVVKGVQSDGTVGFRPKIPVPATLSLVFLLQKNNLRLDGFTDSRISRPLPALYYFSNQDCPDPKVGPFMANAISDYTSGYPYEMGELFFVGGALNQFTADGSGTPYSAVKNSGFISENDRLLMPLSFLYAFSSADAVTQASFVLTDINGQVIKTITTGSVAAGAAVLQQVSLDFSSVGPAVIGAGGSLPLYSLDVSGNGSYSKTFKILFYADERQLRSCWGVIEILPTVKTAVFDLLTDEGFLVPAVAGAPDHPVFEVRIKSRLAYWRYQPGADGFTLSTNAGTTNYLTPTGGALVTKAPRISTYTPTLFTTDNINYDNLPNPVYGSVLAQSGEQFFQDIWVQKTELFS